MLFGQFSNINIYVRVVGKKQEQYFNVMSENYWTNLSRTFNKNQDLFPSIGEEQCIEMLFWHLSNNPDKCVYVGKFL